MFEVDRLGDQSPLNLQIKEEPFEELYVPEAILETIDTHRINDPGSCCLCLEGERLQNLLLEHIEAFHPENVSIFSESKIGLTCCFCSEGMKIQTDLINHLLSHFAVKSEVDSIKIDFKIPESFDYESKSQESTKERLEENLRKKESRRYSCSLCCKKFSSKQSLQKHTKHCHEEMENRRSDETDSSKVQCEFCPKMFKYKQGAKKHWDLEHNPLNLFPCPKVSCSSRCKTLKNLHAHLRIHEPPRQEGLNNLQCHRCLKVFPTQKQLSLHFYTHREKFFCCDKCGSKFNNREQIKNHVMRHVGLLHKKVFHQRIICDQCSMMVFVHKMKRHKLIHHSDEKPFACEHPGCDAAFSDNRMLKDHMNIHLNAKPYVCEFCSESFRSGSNLRLHRVRHTDPERYRCIECQTSFVTKQALQKHNRRHTDDPECRPYACEFPGCNSTFKQKEHVRNHVRRIHEKNNEVFNCEMCTKTYNRKDVLRKHMRKTHNIVRRKSRVFPQDPM